MYLEERLDHMPDETQFRFMDDANILTEVTNNNFVN